MVYISVRVVIPREKKTLAYYFRKTPLLCSDREEVVDIAPAETGFIVPSSLRADTLYPLGLRRVFGP